MQTLLVFLIVAALSVAASNQRLLQAGRFFNLAQLSASGLVFLVFGAALGPSALNLLVRNDLNAARPLVALGLGLAGILLGLNLDPQLLRALPRKVWLAATAQSGFAFLAVGLPLAAIFLVALRWEPAAALGAAALLGGAASVSSSHFAVLWYRSGRLDRTRGLSISLVAMLDDLMGVAVLALALMFGVGGGVALGLGWVVLAALLGMMCGALTAYLMHDSEEGAELTAILVGSVGLVSGAAAFLKVAALLTGLACGATLAFVGGRKIAAAYRALAKAERPVYLTLLFLIGAHVSLGDWYAWAILPAFVALRFLGKLVGGRVAARVASETLRLPPEPGYALLGQGGVALCLLIEYFIIVSNKTSQLVLDAGAIAAVVNEILASRTFKRTLEDDELGPPALDDAPHVEGA